MDWIFLIYLIVINVITFIVFGIDKFKARKKLWRIPVAVLLALSVAGGASGGLAGMFFFRHKTKKLLFVLGIPLILIAQIILIYLIMR